MICEKSPETLTLRSLSQKVLDSRRGGEFLGGGGHPAWTLTVQGPTTAGQVGVGSGIKPLHSMGHGASHPRTVWGLHGRPGGVGRCHLMPPSLSLIKDPYVPPTRMTTYLKFPFHQLTY